MEEVRLRIGVDWTHTGNKGRVYRTLCGTRGPILGDSKDVDREAGRSFVSI